MSKAKPARTAIFVFSLRQLLTLTALIAVTVAFVLAYLRNYSLSQQQQELLSLSGHLPASANDKLAESSLPRVADDFYSWQVNVPVGNEYVLRLGIGPLSDQSVPPIVGSAPLSAGLHRVTLHTGDSPKEEFNYVVYVDGKPLIEKKMGSDWLPAGWSSARGISWPSRWTRLPAPLQLGGQSYLPRRDFGPNKYFNGQGDSFVTHLGYRLWIDQAAADYPASSPFLGLPEDPTYEGIGLNDGLRFKAISSNYEWQFTRPSLESLDQLLRIESEFAASDGRKLSKLSQPLPYWEVRNEATGSDKIEWNADPNVTTQTAFLHAVSNAPSELQPVVELKWDINRPDEVGLRLADTPANESIVQWRLRILGGSHHLWRMLKDGERAWITPDDVMPLNEGNVEASENQSLRPAKIELAQDSSDNHSLEWRTDEALPLQIAGRGNKNYLNMNLYRGLPATFGIQIPREMKPSISVAIQANQTQVNKAAFPGGPVFEEIQIDMETITHDWIWLRAKLTE